MELHEVKSAIENKQRAIYDGGKYFVVGYKLEINQYNEKLYSVGLRERKGMQRVIWVKLRDVELEKEQL